MLPFGVLRRTPQLAIVLGRAQTHSYWVAETAGEGLGTFHCVRSLSEDPSAPPNSARWLKAAEACRKKKAAHYWAA